MKTIKQLLITIAVLLCSIIVNAHDFEVYGIYYNITSSTDLTVAVTYKGYSVDSYTDEYFGNVTVPNQVIYQNKTYSVTTIDYAFADCKNLTNITIPNSVISIGSHAFYNCTSLASITIPNSVTTIGDCAFMGCKNLTNITIPNSVTSIGDYAFKNCKNLTNITIPNSVTSIGDYAFADCKNLTNITIPNIVTSIGSYAFYNCTSLVSVTIPTSIGDYTFYNCTSLASIIILNSVTSIGSYAFYNCTSLASITIPNSVTTIGVGAFINCTSLKNLCIEDSNQKLILGYAINGNYGLGSGSFKWSPLETIYLGRNLEYQGGEQYGYSPFYNETSSIKTVVLSDKVTSIGYNAFYGCYNLEYLTMSNNVTKIESGAFSGCSGLKEIVIPSSVTSIGSSAFGDCTSLERIYMLSRIANVYNENIFSTTTYNNATLYVPEGREFAYSKTVPWSNFYIKELKNSYNVTYKIDSEIYAIYSVECFSEIPMPDAPTKEGYTFSGWSEVPETMPAEDIEITGSFSVNTYAITYIVDGEVYAADSLAYGSEIVLIDEPTKEGHTFSGWSEIPETMPAEDITITGSFSVNTYAITYMVDSEVYATDSLAYGSEIVLIDEPTKEGYTFSGWSEAPETMPANDITITGSFSVNSYTITYIVDGEVYATESLAYGSEIVLIDEPTKEGYTFSGWSEAPETMPAEDITITGSFSVNTYAVTYIVDGEVYATDSLAYGSEIVLIDEPTKEGYTFSGWSETPETMPAEDIEITGSFSVNAYAITYIVDGEAYATDSLTYGSEIVLIDEPTKEGYTFSGWSEVPETMPANDITITGSFSVNTYTITYIVDGEVYATDSLAYGSEIVLIDEPTKEGYTFSGWSEAPETMPAEDITITGSFSVNTYTITYIVDGEVYATDELTYGSEIVLIDEPTKEGYTFSGWSEAPETMPAEDITITGSFIPTENVSEVEFDANIQTTNNGIILLNANNNWVRVYAINGILVKKIDNYTGEEITLNKGVYIVSVGNKAIKIML